MSAATLVAAVAAAEAAAATAHQTGACASSEWSCTHCESQAPMSPTHVPSIRFTGSQGHGRVVPYCPCGWTGVSVSRAAFYAEDAALQVARQHVATEAAS